MNPDLIFFTNGASAVAVSVDGWTDGYIFLPDGRVVVLGYPWVEAEEELKMTEAQRDRVTPLLEGLADKKAFRDTITEEILGNLGKAEIKSDFDIGELFK